MYRMVGRSILYVTLSSVCVFNAYSARVATDKVVTNGNAAVELQHRLNALKTMSANFSQSIHANHRVLSRSSGTMALRRPGQFLWNTQSPMPQRVIADGQHIWIYDIDLAQVSVKKQSKGLGGTPALFLSGYNDTVTRDFTVISTKKGSHDVYDLRPRTSKDNFNHIQLGFRANVLSSIDLYDQLGQHTSVQLSNIKVNSPLPARLFLFKPPKGVDVVQQ